MVTTAPELVLATVTAGLRRVDLALPSAVPVAELLPELARSVGLLDTATAHWGYRLSTTDGRPIATGTGLGPQGVVDGAVLVVTAGVDVPAPRVHDDVVEAMADAVAGLAGWQPAAGRRTGLVAGALLLLLGAAGLARSALPLAPVLATAVAVALCCGSVVSSRTGRCVDAAVTLAVLAGPYAGVAGLLLASGHPLPLGERLAAAGGAVVLTGSCCLVGLRSGRVLTLPPVLLGGLAVVIGLSVRSAPPGGPIPARVVMGVLTVVVLSCGVLPRLALAATGTRAQPVLDGPVEEMVADAVDSAVVAADARTAHELLVALTATVGAAVVLATPVAVAAGGAGTLLAVVAAALLMLRARHHHVGAEVLTGLVAGITALTVAAVSVLVMHPAWCGFAIAVLIGGATLVLASTLGLGPGSTRRGRLADLAEAAAGLAMLPLLVLALDLPHAVFGLLVR